MKRRVLTLQAPLGPAEGRVSSLPLSTFPPRTFVSSCRDACGRRDPEADGGIPGSSILQPMVTFSQKGNYTVTNNQWKKKKNILLNNNSGVCGALGMCSTCFQTDFELTKQSIYLFIEQAGEAEASEQH